MENLFKTIKCENCGKEIDYLETQYIRFGKEKYNVCLECKKLSEEFKQTHKLT